MIHSYVSNDCQKRLTIHLTNSVVHTKSRMVLVRVRKYVSYGIEVYGSCSDTSLERLQVIQNKLLKLLLRLDPYSSTNLLHSELNISKVKDLYNISLLLLVHANLQGDCPAAVKNYFVRRNSVSNTRQTGHLEYRRARLDLGTSRVQYHAAELWNLLSDVIKIFHVENISNVIYVKILYKDTMNNFYRGDATSHKSCKSSQTATNDDNILHNLKVVPCYCYCCLFCILLYN